MSRKTRAAKIRTQARRKKARALSAARVQRLALPDAPAASDISTSDTVTAIETPPSSPRGFNGLCATHPSTPPVDPDRVPLAAALGRQCLDSSTEDHGAKRQPTHPIVSTPIASAARTFPLHTLPKSVQNYITASSKSLDCSTSSVALPVLSALAASIGSSCQIQLKPGWNEPAVLWTATVTDPTSQTSFPLDAATRPLEQTQLDLYKMRCESHEQLDLEPATLDRVVVRHSHLPSMLKLLAQQSKSLLLAANRLDPWLGSTRGGNRRALELATWDDLYAGRTVVVPKGKAAAVPVEGCSICVTGNLSSANLIERLRKGHGPGELLSRTLIAMPQATFRRWTADIVPDSVHARFKSLVENLQDLIEVFDGEPQIVALSPEAEQAYTQFLNQHAASKHDHDDALTTWLAGLPSQAARLALVIHLSRFAAGENVDPKLCDHTSMHHALELAHWFAEEAIRVLSLLSLKAEDKNQQELLEWVQRQGGVVSRRDVNRALRRKYATAEAAQTALHDLATSGLGHWIHCPAGENGGPPHQLFALGPAQDAPTPAEPHSNRSQPAELRNITQEINLAADLLHEIRTTAT